MNPKDSDFYYDACLEIESALESLLDLSNIIESIAMEASITGDKVDGIDKKKKTLAVKKMAEDWVAKYDAWGKKLDQKLAVDPDLDDGKVTNILETIAKTVEKTRIEDENKKIREENELIKEIVPYIDELGKEIEKAQVKVNKAKAVVKAGLFKSARAKLASIIKKHATMIEKDGYAEMIRDDIKVANKVMQNLNKIKVLPVTKEQDAVALEPA